MTSDGMDWLEEIGPAEASSSAQERALEGVAEAARLALYNAVRAVFEESCAKEGLTRAELARRLGSSRELVNRWLRQPSNMTIETAAKLLFSMGDELRISARSKGQGASHPASLLSHQHNFWLSYPVFGSTVRGFDFIATAPTATNGRSACNASVLRTAEVCMLTLTGSDGHDGVYEQVEAFSEPAMHLTSKRAEPKTTPPPRLRPVAEVAHA